MGAERIIGGYPIDIRRVPYQVSVKTYGSHVCGGALISEYNVLTAAHCFHELVYFQFKTFFNNSNNKQMKKNFFLEMLVCMILPYKLDRMIIPLTEIILILETILFILSIIYLQNIITTLPLFFWIGFPITGTLSR